MIGDINLEVMVRFTAHFPGHVWAVNLFIGAGD